MLIKFKKPDPRAGTTVRMDSSRGRHFIGTGAADEVSEQVGTQAPANAVQKPSEAPLSVSAANEASNPVGAKKRQTKTKA